MSIFVEILSKQMPNISLPNIDNRSYETFNYSKQYDTLYYSSIQLIYSIYYLQFDNSHNKRNILHKNKFTILNSTVLKNTILNLHEYTYLFSNFCYAQKIYNIFRKFAYKCKLKYGKKFTVYTDLCFTSFDKLNPKILISLVEDNIIYTFRISDLLNIINKSLTHCSHFFAEPHFIKNPYTNLAFSTNNLYNIYFKILSSKYRMPILFQEFFACNFNINIFKNNNECYIRERCIENFINEAPIYEQYEYIMKMFLHHQSIIYFKIDPLFPKPKLVKIFKKYLLSYLYEEYSLNPYIRDINKINLQYNLTIFSQLNPDFGKKIWIRKRNNTGTSLSYTFNDTIVTSNHLIENGYYYTSERLRNIENINNNSNNEYESNIVLENNEPINENHEENENNEDDEEVNEDDTEAEEYEEGEIPPLHDRDISHNPRLPVIDVISLNRNRSRTQILPADYSENVNNSDEDNEADEQMLNMNRASYPSIFRSTNL